MEAASADTSSRRLLTAAALKLAAAPAIAGLTAKGTVAYTAGSLSDNGAIQIEVAGLFAARTEMTLSGGSYLEIANQDAGLWSGPDGVKHATPPHNAMTVAGRLSPAHIVQTWLTDPTFQVSDAGSETQDGETVERLHCVRIFQKSNVTTNLLQAATAMDVLIDTSTSLPVELDFNQHPDTDEQVSIPVRVVFSDYRPVSGVLAPFHIEEYLQGSLQLDIMLETVSLTPAIPVADFLLQ